MNLTVLCSIGGEGWIIINTELKQHPFISPQFCWCHTTGFSAHGWTQGISQLLFSSGSLREEEPLQAHSGYQLIQLLMVGGVRSLPVSWPAVSQGSLSTTRCAAFLATWPPPSLNPATGAFSRTEFPPCFPVHLTGLPDEVRPTKDTLPC